MKGTIVTLVVMLIAPLAFAQTSSTHQAYHTRYRSAAFNALIFLHPGQAKASIRFRIRRLDTDTDSAKPC